MVKAKEPESRPELMRGSLYGMSGVSPDKGGFSLTCVTAFTGRDNAGHYYTYRIHKEEHGLGMRRWVRASDSTVTPVTINDVLNATKNCVLLHYELPLK